MLSEAEKKRIRQERAAREKASLRKSWRDMSRVTPSPLTPPAKLATAPRASIDHGGLLAMATRSTADALALEDAASAASTNEADSLSDTMPEVSVA